jgi:hypothetical protein
MNDMRTPAEIRIDAMQNRIDQLEETLDMVLNSSIIAAAEIVLSERLPKPKEEETDGTL